MPFLLIDKPVGPTSHDIVDRVRRKTGERRVGHAGTLDPFASGLLIIGVGRESTRELGTFLGMDKDYEATFVLGGESDTDDSTGKITLVPLPKNLTKEKIKTAIQKFLGEIQQVPPAYSAIKIKGQKMYEAARAGKPLIAEPRTVTIYKYEMVGDDDGHDRGGEWPFAPTITVRVKIKCSSGTYIRALARDLGRALGTGGYVSELRRTAIGEYRVENAETF
ncbi:MAG: tRNA pseudouridine synthase B [Candidatus Uhrbacteria bacterium GW2011_GWF2_44_350]|uniref:tRNA pseudouridine synthase B n=1 Tax=Candidatus Uhrbacteria bacterium GW2011_GWF2_44_350 TaxID=1619000 RepID=A0A0G1JE23_9BACT|nr:MAG: tRNA pseudouridine synthase B [Candidatus Uhrbacteria bacterium GW2011_GWF2_44_350]HBR80647.1 tRNA pseudouridine(55) synthase TruB [Candidatus Uhrbacteria bacterium]HCU32189.1 tRNA pseudouridine(55) synthase TruB [Candidatus Uhrbacteria bacterium]